MKVKLLIALLMLGSVVSAQDFEGTIRWSMKMDITDPKLKKQMAEAEEKMKDPATQAQMKAAMEQMNNPEMKKMMESNPQLKAQMEAVLKNMQGGSVASIMPTGMTLKTKNGNALSKIDGGMMSGTETLYQKGKNESYWISRDNKTYSVIPHNTESSSTTVHDPKVTVTKTSETQKILNYTCKKTIVAITDGGQTINQIFWTTNELKGIDFKSMGDQKMGKGKQAMYYKELDGVPLKMEMTMPQGTMVMQVTEIKKETLPASDFEIPTGFTKTGFMGQ